jgi:hypothetical protein
MNFPKFKSIQLLFKLWQKSLIVSKFFTIYNNLVKQLFVRNIYYYLWEYFKQNSIQKKLLKKKKEVLQKCENKYAFNDLFSINR